MAQRRTLEVMKREHAAQQEAERPSLATLPFEPHFTVKEIAKQWHMGERKVFDIFVAEEGIIRLGERSSHRRTRISIRIPLSVAQRVYARITGPETR